MFLGETISKTIQIGKHGWLEMQRMQRGIDDIINWITSRKSNLKILFVRYHVLNRFPESSPLYGTSCFFLFDQLWEIFMYDVYRLILIPILGVLSFTRSTEIYIITKYEKHPYIQDSPLLVLKLWPLLTSNDLLSLLKSNHLVNMGHLHTNCKIHQVYPTVLYILPSHASHHLTHINMHANTLTHRYVQT